MKSAWLEQFSVEDETIIDALDERTRAAVERYARSFGDDDDEDDDDENEDADFDMDHIKGE